MLLSSSSTDLDLLWEGFLFLRVGLHQRNRGKSVEMCLDFGSNCICMFPELCFGLSVMSVPMDLRAPWQRESMSCGHSLSQSL